MSLESRARERGARVEVVASMRRAVHPARDAKALFDVARIIRRERADIVHTHTAKAGAIGRPAARINRVPVLVHTFHGHVFDGYFDSHVTERFLRIERTLARVTDQILVLSDAQKQDIVDRYRIAPASKVRVVPLGLELDHFRKARSGGSFRKELGLRDEPLIVALGRVVPIKRLDRLLRAFAGVNARLPRAHLVIVGDGEAAERRKLVSLAEGLNVHFVGYRSDTSDILAAADVLALTSDNEGTPVAVIEALVCGTPVVATDVGGVREIIPNGCGFVIGREDEKALATALAESCLVRRRIADSVRDDVLGRYSHRRLIRDIESLYDELLEEKQRLRGPPSDTRQANELMS
ncbi:MAG: glycosyltransferase family 4 protein [Myxococcales bacterium]|nr:glycosyltransferase family 4 protein [Myxococcales bacterium]